MLAQFADQFCLELLILRMGFRPMGLYTSGFNGRTLRAFGYPGPKSDCFGRRGVRSICQAQVAADGIPDDRASPVLGYDPFQVSTDRRSTAQVSVARGPTQGLTRVAAFAVMDRALTETRVGSNDWRAMSTHSCSTSLKYVPPQSYSFWSAAWLVDNPVS